MNQEIKRIHIILNGIKKGMVPGYVVLQNTALSYNKHILEAYRVTKDENFNDFLIPEENFIDYYGSDVYVEEHVFKMYIEQALNYIGGVYDNSNHGDFDYISQLMNSIKDDQIQQRCVDIILGDGPYDRAINQATQILEDRVKRKAKLESSQLHGSALVSKAIHSKLEETILKFSDDPEIQGGYSAIFKGVISIYRNQTHHSFEFIVDRDYAIKVCLYIDKLLEILELSEYVGD